MLPIGLGVFAGVSVIALFVVGIVTYERAKHRRVRLSCARRHWLPNLMMILVHRTLGSSSSRKLAPEWDTAQRKISSVTRNGFWVVRP